MSVGHVNKDDSLLVFSIITLFPSFPLRKLSKCQLRLLPAWTQMKRLIRGTWMTGERLPHAPGPLVYANTDVPQIPNAVRSVITLSREHCAQHGISVKFSFCSLFHIWPFLAYWHAHAHSPNPQNTHKHKLLPTYCHTQSGSNFKTGLLLQLPAPNTLEVLWMQTGAFRWQALSEKPN